MALSFSNAKILSAALTKAINGCRGFSAAAGKGGMGKKTGEDSTKKVFKPIQRVSWVPDPRTGFYRPENVAEDVCDAAYQRALHLKN
ncbi:Protein SENESCENCE-ASSOCIATED GENE 21, mitochondrial [Linum grandiflorum]